MAGGPGFGEMRASGKNMRRVSEARGDLAQTQEFLGGVPHKLANVRRFTCTRKEPVVGSHDVMRRPVQPLEKWTGDLKLSKP